MRCDLDAEKIKFLLLKNSTRQLDSFEKNSFRCSALPICPVKWALTELVPIRQRRTFSTDFFAGIGTHVHTIIQSWLGENNFLYGNWKCENWKCKHTINDSTISGPCEKCGSTMIYQEFKVKCPDSGLSGHVDGIIRMPDYDIVVDFKTSKSHSESYEHQIMCYWYLLNKYGNYIRKGKFGDKFNIKKAIIFYIQRSNPWSEEGTFYKVYDNLDDSFYHENVKRHKKAIEILKTKNYLELVNHPICNTKEECKYCPYSSFECHDKISLRKNIKNLIEIFDDQKSVLKV